ncbi:hypothetical protein LT493_02895 [Streptomyces tricolor]|nr:hypothetical protein [Streptomyces tricolor]
MTVTLRRPVRGALPAAARRLPAAARTLARPRPRLRTPPPSPGCASTSPRPAEARRAPPARPGAADRVRRTGPSTGSLPTGGPPPPRPAAPPCRAPPPAPPAPPSPAPARSPSPYSTGYLPDADIWTVASVALRFQVARAAPAEVPAVATDRYLTAAGARTRQRRVDLTVGDRTVPVRIVRAGPGAAPPAPARRTGAHDGGAVPARPARRELAAPGPVRRERHPTEWWLGTAPGAAARVAAAVRALPDVGPGQSRGPRARSPPSCATTRSAPGPRPRSRRRPWWRRRSPRSASRSAPPGQGGPGEPSSPCCARSACRAAGWPARSPPSRPCWWA